MIAKYKPGDRVYINPYELHGGICHGVYIPPQMLDYAGEIVTIKDSDENKGFGKNESSIVYTILEYPFWWPEGVLDIVTEVKLIEPNNLSELFA